MSEASRCFVFGLPSLVTPLRRRAAAGAERASDGVAEIVLAGGFGVQPGIIAKVHVKRIDLATLAGVYEEAKAPILVSEGVCDAADPIGVYVTDIGEGIGIFGVKAGGYR